ncbi:hypothetical protein RSSM_01831 [Rhodopirellula sallentina SM41]|uniref:Uncharacterized protein n=1 Tax=Rhodopirellula sallentina SM41 TaxID=1263870 RepID=M5UL55_9BACT|nr:hypothetical protein RSSM_01831 [Rhodopirellula sallentina SM41]
MLLAPVPQLNNRFGAKITVLSKHDSIISQFITQLDPQRCNRVGSSLMIHGFSKNSERGCTVRLDQYRRADSSFKKRVQPGHATQPRWSLGIGGDMHIAALQTMNRAVSCNHRSDSDRAYDRDGSNDG